MSNIIINNPTSEQLENVKLYGSYLDKDKKIQEVQLYISPESILKEFINPSERYFSMNYDSYQPSTGTQQMDDHNVLKRVHELRAFKVSSLNPMETYDPSKSVDDNMDDSRRAFLNQMDVFIDELLLTFPDFKATTSFVGGLLNLSTDSQGNLMDVSFFLPVYQMEIYEIGGVHNLFSLFFFESGLCVLIDRKLDPNDHIEIMDSLQEKLKEIIK